MPYKSQHISTIRKYLNNELSDKERYAFERKMEADPFLSDAVEGYKELKSNELDTTLKQLYNNIEKRKKTKTIPLWMKIAASIFFIIGISTLIFISNQTQQPHLSELQKTESSTDSIIKLQEKNTINKEAININEDEVTEIDLDSENESITIVDDDTSLPEKDIYISRIEKPGVSEKKSISQITINEKELVFSPEEELDFIIENDKPILTGKIEGDKIEATTHSSAGDQALTKGNSFVASDSFIQYKGKVIDNEGLPLPGVTIIEADRPNGTITDIDGNFTIKAPQSGSLLTFDFIGYKQKSVVVTNDSIGEIKLETEALALDEVVTVGYGTERKRNIKRIHNQKETKVDVPNSIKTQPEPLIGLKKFKRKIQRKLKLPSDALSNKISVKITIDTTGDIIDITILTPVNQNFAKELEDTITGLGKWEYSTTNNSQDSCSRIIVFEF